MTYSEPNESDAADVIGTWNCGSGGSSDSSVTATLTDDGVLTISGTGSMGGYSQEYDGRSPWYGARESIISVVIEPGVTSIGGFAFYSCGMTSVVIPEGVTHIYEGAFYLCGNLESVNIPDSVTHIDRRAFYYCVNLESVNIPDSVTSIDTEAFYQTGLETVTVTGELVGEGKTVVPGGVIDSYFANRGYERWNFRQGYGFSVSSLTLRDINSSDYDPNNTDEKGGIAGAEGRILSYKDAEYRWDAPSGFTARWGGYSVSGTLEVKGGSASGTDSEVYLKYDGITYFAEFGEDGARYAVRDLPLGAYGTIEAVLEGYHMEGEIKILDSSPLTASLSGKNINLKINTYTVTLHTGETEGISGFSYKVNGGGAVTYADQFEVNYGDTLSVTALLSERYVFKEWYSEPESLVYGSEENTLTVSSISGNISLTAYASLIPVPLSPSDTYYRITFSSGSYYTVYVNGSSVSSPVNVNEGESVVFRVQTPEGYSAVPSTEGIADLSEQKDGSYRISEIYSNVRVTVTVTADGGNVSGNSSGSNSTGGNGSGNGSIGSSGTDSGNSIPYWIPVLIIAVFLAFIATAWIFLFFIKRRKDDEEEDGN